MMRCDNNYEFVLFSREASRWKPTLSGLALAFILNGFLETVLFFIRALPGCICPVCVQAHGERVLAADNLYAGLSEENIESLQSLLGCTQMIKVSVQTAYQVVLNTVGGSSSRKWTVSESFAKCWVLRNLDQNMAFGVGIRLNIALYFSGVMTPLAAPAPILPFHPPAIRPSSSHIRWILSVVVFCRRVR